MIEVKAIPDGYISNPKKEDRSSSDKVVISLVLTPIPLSTAGGGIDLEQWPKIIYENTRNLKLILEREDGSHLGNISGESILIDYPKAFDATLMNGLWSSMLRLNEEREEIAKYFNDKEDDISATPGPFVGPMFSYPTGEMAKILNCINGTLSALQISRLLSDAELKKSSKSISERQEWLAQTSSSNPLSPFAVQSSTIDGVFNQGELATLNELQNQDKSIKKLDKTNNMAQDALMRIAWAGRAAPPQRFTVSPEISVRPLDDQITNSEIGKATLPTNLAFRVRRKIDKIVEEFRDVYRDGKINKDKVNSFLKQSEDQFRAEDALVTERILGAITGLSLSNFHTEDEVASESNNPLNALADYQISMLPSRNATLAAMKQAGVISQRSFSQNEKDLSEEEPPNIIRRLAGVMAFPDIARQCGMIIDLYVDSDKFPDGKFNVSAQFSGLATQSFKTTCIKKNTAKQFRPWTASKKFYNGFLELGCKGKDCYSNYELLSLNVNAGIEGSTKQAAANKEALSYGELNENLESSAHAQSTAGLALIDRQVLKYSREEWVRSTVPPDEPLLLEDVVIGIRPDVGIRQQDGKYIWMPLTERTLSFPDFEKKDIHINSKLSRNRERDNGSVRLVHRELDLDNHPVAITYETMMTWRNWSLAVPSKKATIAVSKEDLCLSIKISPPKNKLPKLRFGNNYRLGARYVLINGSSISIDEARKHYSTSDQSHLTIGDSFNNKKPYQFCRYEPIAAAEIFFVKNKSTPTRNPNAGTVESSHAESKNLKYDESDQTLITGRGLKVNEGKETAKRFLLAGFTSFDLCELHGSLDGRKSLPKSSYSNLPTDPPIVAPPANPYERHDMSKRGETGKSFKTTRQFVDPMAQVMVIAFYKNGEIASPFEYPKPIVIDLYPKGLKWPNARPVSLELKNKAIVGKHGNSKQRAAIKVGSSLINKHRTIKVEIELEPAEMAELRVWCLPKLPKELEKMAGFHQIEREARNIINVINKSKPSIFASKSVNTPSLNSLMSVQSSSQFSRLEKINQYIKNDKSNFLKPETLDPDLYSTFLGAPIHGINHHTFMNIIHAVQEPLFPPEIETFWLVHRKDLEEEADEEKIRNAWKMFIDHELKNSKDGMPSENDKFSGRTGSQTVLFGGKLKLHRRSTVRIDVLANWSEYRSDITARKVQNKNGEERYKYIPERKLEELTRIDDIPYEINSDDQDTVNLIRNHNNELRFLTKEFSGTQHRRLTVEVKAISRFSSYYDKSINSPESFSVTSNKQLELIVPASTRPAPVDLKNYQSSFHYDPGELIVVSELNPHRPRTIQRRRVLIRLDLGKSWYSSGEGEQLGLVCWPPELFGKKTNSLNVKSKNSSYIPGFVTRWGRDPIRESIEPNSLIPANAFSNLDGTVKAKVPEPLSNNLENNVNNRNNQIECALALFNPKLDPDTGHFYCDIEINSDTYNPFVQLGLVRYQKQALRYREVSTVITKMVSIMPDRELSARKLDYLNGSSSLNVGVELSYSGVSYSSMNAGLLSQKLAGDIEQFNSDHEKVTKALELQSIDIIVMQRIKGPNFSGVPIERVKEGMAIISEIKDVKPNCSKDGVNTVWKFQILYTEDDVIEEASCTNIPVIRLPERFKASEITVLIKEKEYLLADVSTESEKMIDEVHEEFQIAKELNTQLISRTVASMIVDVSLEQNDQEIKDAYEPKAKAKTLSNRKEVNEVQIESKLFDTGNNK